MSSSREVRALGLRLQVSECEEPSGLCSTTWMYDLSAGRFHPPIVAVADEHGLRLTAAYAHLDAGLLAAAVQA